MSHEQDVRNLRDDLLRLTSNVDGGTDGQRIGHENLAANALSVEVHSLLTDPGKKDLRDALTLANPDSPIQGAYVVNDRNGDPAALEFFADGHKVDFLADGSSMMQGLKISRDESGNPTRYEKNGFSLTHDGNQWLYHNDHNDRKHPTVPLDQPSITEETDYLSPGLNTRGGKVHATGTYYPVELGESH